ncbi:hypothetical protein BSKO_01271 [Bryopsis sp. KO-2023]|nr:hypothetical protein BSKO_01271 [Bryopsis sp. KO-2023]
MEALYGRLNKTHVCSGMCGPLVRTPVTCRSRGHVCRLQKKLVPWRPRAAAVDAQNVPTPITLGEDIGFQGVHHVGLLCENLEASLEFYRDLLGLEINSDRPDKKLPYRGAWLWIGSEMIHLMELPNPDPMEDRPKHGGRDRHFCIGIKNLQPLTEALDRANVSYTKSMSGRPAVFFRDPDMNCLECVEVPTWR